MRAYPPPPAESRAVRLWRRVSGSPHQWINSTVAVLALVVSVVTGFCNYQNQRDDRELAEANRIRDQAAQQSALKTSVLSFDVPKVLGRESELRVELRASNVGGTTTSVVAARLTSLADARSKPPTLSIFGPPASLEWRLTEPAPPSHSFRPAIKVEPGSVVDLVVRLRYEAATSTLEELRGILSQRRDIGQLRLEDVGGQFSSVTLWDCAAKPLPMKAEPCMGALFR